MFHVRRLKTSTIGLADNIHAKDMDDLRNPSRTRRFPSVKFRVAPAMGDPYASATERHNCPRSTPDLLCQAQSVARTHGAANTPRVLL